MPEISLGRDLIIIIISAFLMGYLLILAKEPIIVGYILAGVITGGSIFNLVGSSEVIGVLAEIGIALLLFHIGIEFSLSGVGKNKKLAIGGAILQMILSALLLLGIFTIVRGLLNLDTYSSIFISLVFSLSSTAVVVKMLSDSKKLASTSGSIMTSWLVVQDLAVIPISILLLSAGGEGGSGQVLTIIWSLAKAGLILIVSLVLLKRIAAWFFEIISKTGSRELLLIASLAFSLGMAFVTQYLGLSFVLGAFLSGLMLAGTSFYTKIYTDIRSIKDIFTLLFF